MSPSPAIGGDPPLFLRSSKKVGVEEEAGARYYKHLSYKRLWLMSKNLPSFIAEGSEVSTLLPSNTERHVLNTTVLTFIHPPLAD